MANCLCGTTLGLSTDGMSLPDAHRLLGWLKTETARRGVTPTELIGYLRERVREQASANGEPRAAPPDSARMVDATGLEPVTPCV